MQSTVRRRAVGTLIAASVLALIAPPPPAGAISTYVPMNGIASLSTANKAGNKASFDPSVSWGGRFIAFTATSTDLVSGDTNGRTDVFVRDTLADTTTRVSVSSAGGQANGDSTRPAISPDGRYVAFESKASNLVGNDTNATTDIFVRDLVAKTTIRASLRSTGAQSTGTAEWPTISNDGKHVAFQTDDNAMAFGEGNGKIDAYVRDTQNGTTTRMSVDTNEASLLAGGTDPSISSNGRYVVFTSTTNQVGTDTNGAADVFLRDVLNGTTERVSITSTGGQGNDDSTDATVSSDGRYVAFQSNAHNTTADDTGPTYTGVYRRDRTASTTQLVVRSQAGTAAGGSALSPKITADGSKVAFVSNANNLAPGDTNGQNDVFVRTVATNTTAMVSTTTTGGPPDSWSRSAAISLDGTVTAYDTFSSTGFPLDTNGTDDVFYRGRYQIGPFANSL
jgi:Tol biopolymer transport system component